MTTIDLGAGVTVQRHHLPKTIARSFDQASAAFQDAQASIRAWVKPLYAMQAPVTVSGMIECNGPTQTGRDYSLTEPGGAILVDQRDMALFEKLGFVLVPSTQPTAGLRAGLVYFDAPANEYLRFDGANWASVTLV